MWSSDTYEEMLQRLDGNDPEPLDPDTFRCQTVNGVRIEPHETAANSLVSSFRRAVIDSKAAKVDLGKARRFTGGARHAINLWSNQCVRPGCHISTTHCEAAHLCDHAKGARTCPGNGAHYVGCTTDGNNRGSPSGETPLVSGTRTGPTALKSSSAILRSPKRADH
jgi:hypothetical protein